MAAPTDLLNDDVKELKAELRDVRSDVAVLKADVHRIDLGLAELRSEVRSAIGIGKWAGTALATLILTSGIGAIIWGARLDAKVSAMETRIDDRFKVMETRIDDRFKAMELRLDDRFKAVDERFRAVDARFDKMDARFDKLEALILRAIEQPRPAPAAPK